jgi:predicted AlkP superfamily phosphohydrolase/phosphomutase
MGRHFLISEAAQLGDDPQTAAQYAELIQMAYAQADETVGDLLGHVVLGKDTILVVSDHGLAPVHTEVRVNALLRDGGLLRLGSGGDAPVDIDESQAFAIASGGAAHIYVNLEGREAGGIVTRGEYAEVRAEIIDLLESAMDPDGNPVFSRVVLREDLSALGLDSFAAGDIFVQAWPGYVLSDATDSLEAFGEPRLRAAAGYDASQSSMHAIMVAAGFGIRQGVKLPEVQLVDIAPTVAELLRLQQSDHVAGRVLDEMLRGIR